MGFSSQGGHVAFMTQASQGVFPATFNTNAIAMKLRTGGIGANRDLLTPDPEIGGGRDVVDSYLGAVVFSGDLEFYARFNALLTVLYGAFGTKLVTNPGGTSAVQTITVTGTPTGGTFTLTWSAQTTAAIPYNATAAQVQSALEALSNIAPGDIMVTGGPFPGTPMVVTFMGTLFGVQVLMTASSVGLTGGTTPTVTPVMTTAGTAYTGAAVHTFLPSDASSLPYIAIQERIGAGLETFNYTDAVINTLHFESDANGYLMGTAGVIARTQVAGASPLDPTTLFDNLPMVVGTNITVTYNNVSLPAKSFSFDLTNNFEDDDFRLGSFFVGDLTPKRREVSLGFSIREVDSATWRQATYGTTGATTPGGLTTKQQLMLTMATYEAIPGATPTLSYTMKFVIPQAMYEPYTLAASGDDIIESDITVKAVRPSASVPLMRVEVITAKTTVN
jgi:hypothetical protein